MADRPSGDHFRTRFNRLKALGDDAGGAGLEQIWEDGRRSGQSKPQAIRSIRRRTPRRRRDALTRSLEAINALRIAAVTRRLKRQLSVAKALGVTLAPPSALRKQRGQKAYGLTRAHQAADGVHAPAAARLPWLDSVCWRSVERGSGGPYLPAQDLATATPLLEPDQVILIRVLFWLSQHPGRLIDDPLTEEEELVWRWRHRFYEPVWLRPVLLQGWRDFLLDFVPKAIDRDVQRVVRALLKHPDRIGRIRQCDLASCYRFFVDRSPTWATSPARGCPGTTHTVQLHKQESRPPEQTS
jgi:hypothetical protein